MNRAEEFKLAAISLVIFTAWLIAAEGWVRLLAVLWLIYPAKVVMSLRVRRNDD